MVICSRYNSVSVMCDYISYLNAQFLRVIYSQNSQQYLQLYMSMTGPTLAPRRRVPINTSSVIWLCALHQRRHFRFLQLGLFLQPCPSRGSTFTLPIFADRLSGHRILENRKPHTCLMLGDLFDIYSASAAFIDNVLDRAACDCIGTWCAHSHTWLW